MGRQHLLPVYLSALQQAKFSLDKAERSSNATQDPIERLRWSLEVDIQRTLIRMYDGLTKLVQEPE
ncbi:MAG: hypothetical protein WB780_02465 [Candidatus Acidiferrales bacterium]